jgi:hypothetical protein
MTTNTTTLNDLIPERIRNEAVLQLKLKKKKMLIALDKRMGVIAPATKDAGIDRCTHYRWLAKDLVYKNAVEGIMTQTVKWDVDKVLYELELQRTMFILTVRGRNRGYSERQIPGLQNTKKK